MDLPPRVEGQRWTLAVVGQALRGARCPSDVDDEELSRAGGPNVRPIQADVQVGRIPCDIASERCTRRSEALVRAEVVGSVDGNGVSVR